MKKIALLCMLLSCLTVFSQELIICNNEDELYSAIDSIIKKEYYKDSIGDSVKIYFQLKIDSVGEIHSCHVLRADNIDIDIFYYSLIGSSIERHIRVPFLYDLSSSIYYRRKNCLGQYCSWMYPFFKPKKVIK